MGFPLVFLHTKFMPKTGLKTLCSIFILEKYRFTAHVETPQRAITFVVVYCFAVPQNVTQNWCKMKLKLGFSIKKYHFKLVISIHQVGYFRVRYNECWPKNQVDVSITFLDWPKVCKFSSCHFYMWGQPTPCSVSKMKFSNTFDLLKWFKEHR